MIKYMHHFIHNSSHLVLSEIQLRQLFSCFVLFLFFCFFLIVRVRGIAGP